MKAAAIGIVFGIGLIFLSAAHADEKKSSVLNPKSIQSVRTNTDQAQQGEARARLGTNIKAADFLLPDAAQSDTEARVSWILITKFGPASGAQPRIGARSGLSYFDFADDHKLPAFVQQ